MDVVCPLIGSLVTAGPFACLHVVSELVGLAYPG